MSRLFDRLRGAQRAREQSGLLFDALKKAHAEREASRQANEAMALASESANEADAFEDPPAADSSLSRPAEPRRRDARTAAIIALLVVAAALCAAVAWRGTADIEQRSGLRMDPALDLNRIPPERSPAPPAQQEK